MSEQQPDDGGRRGPHHPDVVAAPLAREAFRTDAGDRLGFTPEQREQVRRRLRQQLADEVGEEHVDELLEVARGAFRRGQAVSDAERAAAARARVSADRKRDVETAQWIVDLAEGGEAWDARVDAAQAHLRQPDMSIGPLSEDELDRVADDPESVRPTQVLRLVSEVLRARPYTEARLERWRQRQFESEVYYEQVAGAMLAGLPVPPRRRPGVLSEPRTPEEKRAFSKAWDARVDAAKERDKRQASGRSPGHGEAQQEEEVAGEVEREASR